MTKRPRVFVCKGSSCTKHKDKTKKLLKCIEEVADVQRVDCQDICDGPVVGCALEGKLVWFRELDSRKAREALTELLEKGELKKDLRKHRVGKK